MHSSGRSSYVFPRSPKLIAAEARKTRFLEMLAAWVLMLALALVVTVAAIWLSKWLDENATSLSQSSSRTQNPLHCKLCLVVKRTAKVEESDACGLVGKIRRFTTIVHLTHEEP
jgi:hypothetical protein